MKPFITIRVIEYETESKKGTKYVGLGYSVEYYENIAKVKDRFGDGDKKAILILGGGVEFRLFDKLLIWSWKGA